MKITYRIKEGKLCLIFLIEIFLKIKKLKITYRKKKGKTNFMYLMN